MRPLILLAVVVAAGCAGGNAALRPGTAPLDDTLRVALGGSALTRDNAVRVAFKEKLADSRCPVGVVCVWQGDVGAVVLIETVERAVQAGVHTALDPRSIENGDYRLTLLDMTPRPGEPTAPAVATIRVQR